MVGDRWRDVQAGERAGCKTLLVSTGGPQEVSIAPWKTVSSLAEAAREILAAKSLEVIMAPNTIDQLTVALFADGADLPGMLDMYKKPYVKGFTTNPSLMRKAGVTDYLGF